MNNLNMINNKDNNINIMNNMNNLNNLKNINNMNNLMNNIYNINNMNNNMNNMNNMMNNLNNINNMNNNMNSMNNMNSLDNVKYMNNMSNSNNMKNSLDRYHMNSNNNNEKYINNINNDNMNNMNENYMNMNNNENINSNKMINNNVNSGYNQINNLENKLMISKRQIVELKKENEILRYELEKEKIFSKHLEEKLNYFQNLSNNIYNNEFKKIEILLNEKNAEIAKLKLRFPFELSEGEKLISITFISFDESIQYSIICKNTHKFREIENMFYDKYIEYKNTNNIFLIKGKNINPSKTLEENNIKNGDVISFEVIK